MHGSKCADAAAQMTVSTDLPRYKQRTEQQTLRTLSTPITKEILHRHWKTSNKWCTERHLQHLSVLFKIMTNTSKEDLNDTRGETGNIPKAGQTKSWLIHKSQMFTI